MKLHGLFGKVKVELEEMERLAVLDIETRWFLTFHMIKTAYAARRLFNTVCRDWRGFISRLSPNKRFR